MRVDYGGEFWNYIIGGAVGAIMSGMAAALNGEDTVGIIVSAVAGVVAASGFGLIAQASISVCISATADFINQSVDIMRIEGDFYNYNLTQIAIEATLGFVTSAEDTKLGDVIDSKLTRNLMKSNCLFDKYLMKSFSAGLRKEVEKIYGLKTSKINCNKTKEYNIIEIDTNRIDVKNDVGYKGLISDRNRLYMRYFVRNTSVLISVLVTLALILFL